jgi:hypothetical protein
MPALSSLKTKYRYTEKRNDMNPAMRKGSFSRRDGCRLFRGEFTGGLVIALDIQEVLALRSAHERCRSHVVTRWDRADLGASKESTGGRASLAEVDGDHQCGYGDDEPFCDERLDRNRLAPVANVVR